MIYLCTYRGILYDVYFFYNEADSCFYSTDNDGILANRYTSSKLDLRTRIRKFKYEIPTEQIIIPEYGNVSQIIEERMFGIIINKI